MKASLLIVMLTVSFASFSQGKLLPEIKTGTKMQYTANVNGQEIPVGFSIDSLVTDYLKIGWSVEGYGEGSWIMNKKSLQSATGSMAENPEPGVQMVLPDDKAQLIFSKDQWATLTKDKKVKHNNIEYNVGTPASGDEFKIGDKVVDVVYLESADKSGKIWLLNNPAIPIILKITGNTAGADLVAMSIN